MGLTSRERWCEKWCEDRSTARCSKVKRKSERKSQKCSRCKGIELPHFQRFARLSKYFRTVSSTLVTLTRVTGPQFAYTPLHIVVSVGTDAISRRKLQVQFLLIPENPHK